MSKKHYQKKHYQAIAAIIAGLQRRPQVLTLDSIADALADYFATDNPRFDRARFLAACGVEG